MLSQRQRQREGKPACVRCQGDSGRFSWGAVVRGTTSETAHCQIDRGADRPRIGRMNEKDQDLAEQLREAIRTSGQSLTQLGKGCGIDSARLSRFMRGERGLSFEAT